VRHFGKGPARKKEGGEKKERKAELPHLVIRRQRPAKGEKRGRAYPDFAKHPNWFSSPGGRKKKRKKGRVFSTAEKGKFPSIDWGGGGKRGKESGVSFLFLLLSWVFISMKLKGEERREEGGVFHPDLRRRGKEEKRLASIFTSLISLFWEMVLRTFRKGGGWGGGKERALLFPKR